MTSAMRLMKSVRHARALCGAGLVLAMVSFAGADASSAADHAKPDEGQPDWPVVQVEHRFANDWTEAMEAGFMDRARFMVGLHAGKGYGGTYGENEKRSYPAAMIDFLAGNRDKAMAFLQSRDAENGFDANADGIDFYWCFTLKGQVRKYFLFGPFMDAAYRKKMTDAADKWTRTDPAQRRHPNPGGSANASWGAKKTKVCVDTRSTDNLHAMRIAGVYLFAEATGNEQTRLAYKQEIARAVHNMFRIGMGEWDSENYHGHTMTGYVQLYDFAQDPEVRLMGKAAMDYLLATGAFKYYRGGFCGPTKRDYNHPYVHGGSAADHLGLYFGDWGREQNHEAASDNVHFITSAYRPPMAVVALARKQFDRPAEVFASHPPYSALRMKSIDKVTPAYLETMYFGRTFQFGTLARGTCDADVNGFKMLAYSEERGAQYFTANATNDPTRIGSAQYGPGVLSGNNVAQYGNAAIWLNPQGDAPFIFMVPKSAAVETAEGVTFIQYERTWVALRGVNLAIHGVDEKLTETANVSVRVRRGEQQRSPRWPHVNVIGGKGEGGQYAGFVVEIGEAPDFANYEVFKKAVLSRSSLDVSARAQGRVVYRTSDGRELRMQYANSRPVVHRDGVLHDWAQHRDLYRPADGGKAPIWMPWGDGVLRVEAGGYVFEGRVDADGRYSYTNRRISDDAAGSSAASAQ